MYQQFRTSVLTPDIRVGDGECVSLIVNNSKAYIEYLFPGVNWTTIIPPVNGARELAGKGNQYLQWISNDHNNPNQVPVQGDIMVFDATPAAGYANSFDNPYGHVGICDSADSNGYNLLQQNSPSEGSFANITHYAWKFRPCMGWYRPLTPGTTPAPAPAPTPVTPPPAPTGKTIYLPPTTGPWHLYRNGGPYNPAQAKGVLVPSQFGGLTYPIVAELGNGIVRINSQMYGQGDLWTAGSSVVIK
jgi:hypothetical protein